MNIIGAIPCVDYPKDDRLVIGEGDADQLDLRCVEDNNCYRSVTLNRKSVDVLIYILEDWKTRCDKRSKKYVGKGYAY